MTKTRCQTDWAALHKATNEINILIIDGEGRLKNAANWERWMDWITQRKLAGEFDVCEGEVNGTL